MDRMLIYSTSDGEALVLEVVGEQTEATLDKCGRNIENWPEDLGIYNREKGLWIWEGEISEDDNFNGSLRELTEKEYQNFKDRENVL